MRVDMNNAITESTLQLVTPAWNTPAPLTKCRLSAAIRGLGYDYEDDEFKPDFVFVEPCDVQEHGGEMDCLINILNGKKVSQPETSALMSALKQYDRPFPNLHENIPPSLIADFATKDSEVATEVLVRLSTAPCFNEYLRALASPDRIGIGLFTVVASLFCRVRLPGDFMEGFISGTLDAFGSGREDTDFKMNSFLIFVSKFVLREKVRLSEGLIERLKEFCASHSDLEYSELTLKVIQSHKYKIEF